MKLLFALPAPTIYDNQGRVMSWKHTPTPRESLKRLKELVPRLRELGVTKVVCSDLDMDTGAYLAKKLAIPCEEWTSLRRLNAGKLHGQPTSKFSELLDDMEEKWGEKPDIPLKGGDSRTSYQKRIAATRDRLHKLDGTPLIIASAREILAILEAKAELSQYRIYEVEHNGKPAQAA